MLHDSAPPSRGMKRDSGPKHHRIEHGHRGCAMLHDSAPPSRGMIAHAAKAAWDQAGRAAGSPSEETKLTRPKQREIKQGAPQAPNKKRQKQRGVRHGAPRAHHQKTRSPRGRNSVGRSGACRWLTIRRDKAHAAGQSSVRPSRERRRRTIRRDKAHTDKAAWGEAWRAAGAPSEDT